MEACNCNDVWMSFASKAMNESHSNAWHGMSLDGKADPDLKAGHHNVYVGSIILFASPRSPENGMEWE